MATFEATTTQPEQLREEIYAAISLTSPEFKKNRFAIHRTDIKYKYLVYFEQEPTDKQNVAIAKAIKRHEPDPNFQHYAGAAIAERPTLVEILEQDNDPQRRLAGRYQITTLNMDVPEGAPGEVTTKDFTFPIPISVLAAQLLATDNTVGDTVNFEVAPDTVIGILTANADVNDSLFIVSPTVSENTFVGAFLVITDGQSLDDLGRVLKVADNTVVTENVTTNAYSATSPTYVRQTVRMAHNFQVAAPGRVEIGETKIGSSFIPANVVLRLRYENASGTAKSFGIIIELLY